MAHPMASSMEKMKSDKLHRMTRDYGSADPTSNISAPTNRAKQEGPEDSVGFGAESNAPKARADKASRRAKAPITANPLATYATGGAVNRARGGRTKHKGSTHVNVIVAPQGGAPGAAAGGPPPMPIGGPAGGPPPSPPMAPPPHPPMMPPGAMGAPGGMPPGPMAPAGGMPGLRAGGGRTYAKGGAVGHYDAGAGSAEGRLEKIKNYGKRAHEKPQAV